MQIIARFTDVNTLDSVAQGEAVGYHCFRGLLTVNTAIYVSSSFDSFDATVNDVLDVDTSMAQLQALDFGKNAAGLMLLNNR